ncbi:MAG: rhodanese-like domain-containing protein, partial [Bacteroidaceae bacterium]|nr:rhodanese-like domain-containing protein [Bacteroidaceae bacterium]
RSGRRSASAAQKLVKLGYEVINLDGGILAWQRAKMPIAK